MTVGNDALWRKLCAEVLEAPELPEDPEFASNETRAGNRQRLNAILNDIFSRDTRDNWIAKMRKAGVPAGPIRTVGEALTSPEAAARQIVKKVPHTAAGKVSVVKSPMHLSGTPVRDPVGSPLHGEHSEQILRGVLGYDSDRIAELAASGAVKLG